MGIRAQPWLGTIVSIRAGDAGDKKSDAKVHAALDAAFAAISKVHALMSFHDPESELSQLNRCAHLAPVAVSEWTYQVIQHGIAIADASDGLFDFTVASDLVASGMLPLPYDSADIPKNNSRRPSFRDVRLRPQRRIRFAKPLWIDLGGIAKGFAVDLAVAALREHGVEAGSVNAGGDIRLFGPRPETIWVRKPEDSHSLMPVIELHEAAIATSASYFCQRPSADGPASAIVNPVCGRPSGFDMSVSVLAPDCMTADALTKVVTLSEDNEHPALKHFGASALLLRKHAQALLQ